MSDEAKGPRPIGDTELAAATGGFFSVPGQDNVTVAPFEDMAANIGTLINQMSGGQMEGLAATLMAGMQALDQAFEGTAFGMVHGSLSQLATMLQSPEQMAAFTQVMNGATVSYESVLMVQSMMGGTPPSGGDVMANAAAMLESRQAEMQVLLAALADGSYVLPQLPIWSPSADQPSGQAFLDQQAQHLAAGGSAPSTMVFDSAAQLYAQLSPYAGTPELAAHPVYGPLYAFAAGIVEGRQGSEGGDLVQGGGLVDRMFGHGGDDVIQGNATGGGTGGLTQFSGRDTIDGGAGRDTIMADGTNPNAAGSDDYVTGGVGDRAADLVNLGGGNDIYVWRPGDGNDLVSFGTGSTDQLQLVGVTPAELAAGLQLPPNVYLAEIPGNPFTFRFIDHMGHQVESNGTFTIGGETLTFTNVDVLRLPFPGQSG
jgi:hypothetical protein